ncbi:MAG: hypothetical protein QMD09_15385 [Desulfatibacillaceae bacterium]|nr:hypothetical protein [Desulfatibacillaceae bacterium]
MTKQTLSKKWMVFCAPCPAMFWAWLSGRLRRRSFSGFLQASYINNVKQLYSVWLLGALAKAFLYATLLIALSKAGRLGA